MKRSQQFVTGCLLMLGAFAPALADTVEMKDGTTVTGTYAGGTPTTVNIETPQGLLAIKTEAVSALKFSGVMSNPAITVIQPASATTAAAPAAVAPAAPAAAAPISVPAGTVLTVRMDKQVASTDPPGTTFTGKLVGDVTAGNATVAKAGSTVSGRVDKKKQAGRLAGKSELEISLTGIEIGGKTLPIMTTNYTDAGKGEFRRTARNVAAGALIGNAIDDDGGAGKGAAVGAGASLIKKGDSVTVPPGALLEFRLSQPVMAAPL
jgi:hypothetical protein